MEFKDRIVEKALTYNVQHNADGTITLIPAPGTVYQEGTKLNKAVMDKLINEPIKAVLEKENWMLNEESGIYEYTIEDTRVSFFDDVSVNIAQDSIETANDCGIKSFVNTDNGLFRIFSDAIPENDINATYIIFYGDGGANDG